MNTKTKTNAKTNTGKAKWTAKQIERAKRKYAAFTSDRRAKVDKAERECGMEPWEYVADTLCMLRGGKSKAANSTCGKATTAKGTETIRERWHRHVVVRLEINAECNRENGHFTYIPQKWLEEIEGRPLADVITDWLCEDHGLGVKNPTPHQKYNIETDAFYESAGTRARNAHDKEVANIAVACHTEVLRCFVNDDELHDFIRHFYHKGDRGMDWAIARAVTCALKLEKKANASR